MTTTTPLPLFRRPVRSPRSSGRAGHWPPATGHCKRAVLSGLAALALLHAGFAVWLDHGPPRVRDPEYGKRLTAARRQAATGKPLVACVGSSRLAMGLRPEVASDAPVSLANLALAGSGPVMELMAYRRAVADGLTPAAVLVEYWPAFLDEEGPQHEDARIDAGRLRPVDRPLVRDHFRDPAGTLALAARHTRNPWWGHRKSLMNQVSPGWLPYQQRSDALWAPIDAWGWLPGRATATADDRAKAEAAARGYYEPLFRRYTVSAVADRALRQLLTECRAAGTPVALVYLPESATFRGLMPPAAQQLADDHLAAVRRDTGVPLIDCRGWVADRELVDGFHLTRDGAAELTPKLAAAVAAWVGAQ